jgi:DNA-dependent RNA polymerase auxiliary subunit epsilon
MLDLYNKQYDRQTLKDNIYAIDFLDLLKTQKIDASFAVRYLLNEKYDLDDKYNIITPELIVKFQHHIKISEIRNEILNYESDDDSVTDFETVSNQL